MDKNYIYRFTLNKETTVESWVDEVIDGREARVPVKQKKTTPIEFGLKRPSKSQRDDLDLKYKVYFSEAVKAGVLPQRVLERNIADSDGVFTKKDLARKEEILKEYTALETKIAIIREDLKKPEVNKEALEKDLTDATNLMLDLFSELDALNRKEQILYSHSAEGYATSKTQSYLFAKNSFNITENKDFFDGTTLEEKLQNMQDLDETPDDFANKALKILMLAVSIYFNNDRASQEDIDNYIKKFFSE